MTAPDPDELDRELRARVAEQVAERAARRDRMRRVRQQFDERRKHGKAKAHAQKLRRAADEGSDDARST